ncbi:transcriptional regulator, TetR family [Catenulispora acidiphila DSM 44928]|uniref:Transcriptional regulator, TetR family n=1 Tax=Catenulispora acidiphila (strain DSM 44928 / JCM 14897 / NBRC 102108 / NRRL B-24433 / ID139908) TaxID=479433 RepID=C7Q833_CATAD|nr:TetR/AcrR family transcriptional regulator [Catenulispora acidiphila]ACU74200.1 transcriptional regulator, TetR family [Catenulispora acidiphila DSM 44928]
MAVQARERLLTASEELFYAEGIRAVGVERILTASGVGRASFYRHFAGKDELVVAVLTRTDERWREWLRETVTGYGLPPAERPIAVFDALGEWLDGAGHRGCAFINAMVEAADRTSPIHEAAAAHKEAVTDYLARLLAEAGRDDHETLAPELMLLIEGALVTSQREGTSEAAIRAGRIARVLLARQPDPRDAVRRRLRVVTGGMR